MDNAIALARSLVPDSAEFARAAIVYGCALALIMAG